MFPANYPQGMGTYNNMPYTGGLSSWKGSGVYSNPVAITSKNIRPLTNKDVTNDAPQKFGLARPMKHYRKGSVVSNQGELSRSVRSATTSSLIGQLIDRPGSFSVKENKNAEINEELSADKDCMKCNGAAVIADYYPSTNLTNNPRPVVESYTNCCNEQKKALRRVRPASTNLSKNYFQTLQQYRQNRCQTYDQKIFNFATSASDSLNNEYVANCYPNAGRSEFVQSELVQKAFEYMVEAKLVTAQDVDRFYQGNIDTIAGFAVFITTMTNSVAAADLFKRFMTNPYYGMSLTGPANVKGCKLVIYKPSNPQFAVQGGVSSSARNLKLSVQTIQTNLATNKKMKYDQIYQNKSKATTCINNNCVGINPTQKFPWMYKRVPNNNSGNQLVNIPIVANK
jgi:hypothetical protein